MQGLDLVGAALPVEPPVVGPQNIPAFDGPRHGFPDGGVNDHALLGLHAHVLGERDYAFLRPIIPEVAGKFMGCGDFAKGFVRVRCDHCDHCAHEPNRAGAR